jgi:hypothetical protein
MDELSNADQEKAVLLAEPHEIRQTRHAAIVVHDLADYPRGF